MLPKTSVGNAPLGLSSPRRSSKAWLRIHVPTDIALWLALHHDGGAAGLWMNRAFSVGPIRSIFLGRMPGSCRAAK